MASRRSCGLLSSPQGECRNRHRLRRSSMSERRLDLLRDVAREMAALMDEHEITFQEAPDLISVLLVVLSSQAADKSGEELPDTFDKLVEGVVRRIARYKAETERTD